MNARKLPLFLAIVLLAPALVPATAAGDEVPPELLKSLKDSDPEERLKALKALSKRGVEAVPPLVEALKDPEADVREAAAYSLRGLRVEPAKLLEALRPHARDASAPVRQGVAALGRCGLDGLPLLLPAVKDADLNVRKQAILAFPLILQKFPDAAERILPALTGAIRDDSEVVRLAAVQVLPRCGNGASRALLDASADTDPKVRANAIGSLGLLKLDVREALPVLTLRLKDDQESIVRQSAARTLGKLGGEAVPALAAALEGKEDAVRMVALRSLGQIGVDAKSAVPAVKKVAVDAGQPGLRTAAILTLGKLGPDADPVLIDLIKDGDSSMRTACLQCFGKRGKAPKAAVPNLIAALADPDLRVRALAAFVLGTIGPDAADAIPALTKALDGSDERLRPIVEKALKNVQGK